MKKDLRHHLVCFGGGTGLSTLLLGLKKLHLSPTAIVTMCDEGGSTGRLRRSLGSPAVGDLRHCMTTLSQAPKDMTELLSYRFKGNRYNNDDSSIEGQNLGNLLLVAAKDITGNLNAGIDLLSRIFKVRGQVIPSTLENVRISALTADGVIVEGEENIDLGRYDGTRTIEKLSLLPEDAKGSHQAILAIRKASCLTAGPGDLFTSIMPNFLIKEIRNEVKKSTVRKVLVINIANKPFETPNFTVLDYLKAIEKHIGFQPFTHVVVNTNQKSPIPSNLKYTYVPTTIPRRSDITFLLKDVVNEPYPLFHDPVKLAKVIHTMLQ